MRLHSLPLPKTNLGPVVWVTVLSLVILGIAAGTIPSFLDRKILTLLVLLILGLAGYRWPLFVVLLATVAVCIISPPVVGYITGVDYGTPGTTGLDAFLKLHPATIPLVTSIMTCLIFRPRLLTKAITAHKWIKHCTLLMSFFIVSVFVLNFALHGSSGLAQLLDNFCGPFSLFLLLLIASYSKPKSARLFQAFIILVAAAAAYSILEYVTGENFLVSVWETQQWFVQHPVVYRSMSFIGHPVWNGQYYVAAGLLSAVLLPRRYRLPLLLVFFGGTICTGTRSAFVNLAVGCFLLFILEALGPRRGLKEYVGVLAVGITLAIGCYFLLTSSFGLSMLDRFLNDYGSTEFRVEAWQYIMTFPFHEILLGKGLGYSYELAEAYFGRVRAFENPWFMLAVDVGIPLILTYVMALVCISLSLVLRSGKSFYWDASIISRIRRVIPFVFLLLMMSFHNSFGGRTPLNYLPWLAGGLLVCHSLFERSIDRGEP